MDLTLFTWDHSQTESILPRHPEALCPTGRGPPVPGRSIGNTLRRCVCVPPTAMLTCFGARPCPMTALRSRSGWPSWKAWQWDESQDSGPQAVGGASLSSGCTHVAAVPPYELVSSHPLTKRSCAPAGLEPCERTPTPDLHEITAPSSSPRRKRPPQRTQSAGDTRRGACPAGDAAGGQRNPPHCPVGSQS